MSDEVPNGFVPGFPLSAGNVGVPVAFRRLISRGFGSGLAEVRAARDARRFRTMLYLVISSPHPSRADDVKSARLQFRSWVDELKSKGKVVCFYPRVGRGSVVIFDVVSNDELHKLATRWSDIVPAAFDFYPLATPSEAEALLK